MNEQNFISHLATIYIVDQQLCLEDKSQYCIAGDIFQCCLLGDKICNFTISLSSGEPQPIISNVALGPLEIIGFSSPLDKASLLLGATSLKECCHKCENEEQGKKRQGCHGCKRKNKHLSAFAVASAVSPESLCIFDLIASILLLNSSQVTSRSQVLNSRSGDFLPRFWLPQD